MDLINWPMVEDRVLTIVERLLICTERRATYSVMSIDGRVVGVVGGG